jgi:hypothetical protein
MFVPHRKLIYRPPQPLTGIILFIYMYTMFIPHRKHIYGPSQPVAGIVLISHSLTNINILIYVVERRNSRNRSVARISRIQLLKVQTYPHMHEHG